MDYSHTLTLVCQSCNKPQTFQANVSQLVCPNCGWKGAFNLPVTPLKKIAKNGKIGQRSFNERIRDITIQNTKQGFLISWRTFSWRNMLLVIAVLGSGGLFFLIYKSMKATPTDPNVFISIIFFIIIFMLFWAGLGYTALALSINQTVLTIDRKNMSRHHKPLPLWGEFDMPIEFIKLFYAEGLNIKAKSKTTPNKKPEKGQRAEMLLHSQADCYRLVAVLLSDREIPLFSNLSSPEIIFFLQEQITTWVNEANVAAHLRYDQKHKKESPKP